jgi:electron transfer flavoprotein beta subunit
VLAEAINKIGKFDLIFGGRQAIDGDTAQVGPQTAEKLGIPQITYAMEILSADQEKIQIKRKIEGGYEILESKLPVLITVLKDAAFPRPYRAKRVMAYKNAKTLMELEKLSEENSLLYIDQLKDEYITKNLYINTLTMDDLQLDAERCGVAGSPTKVHKVESVVLAAGSHEIVEPTKDGIGKLIDHLMEDHIFG